jgi:hypothetical protein
LQRTKKLKRVERARCLHIARKSTDRPNRP